MSNCQFAPVNPGLWEGLDRIFGTKIAKSAEAYGISYTPRVISSKVSDIEVIVREKIGTDEFKVSDFVSDVEGIASAFGANQELLNRLIGSNDNERFHKALDLLDFIMSGLKMIPLDQMKSAKDALRRVSESLERYVPDTKTIGKLLSLAPGMNKYAKSLMSFGDKLDHAISILNRNGSISDAIDVIREGINELKKIDIADVNDQSVDKEALKEDTKASEVIDAKVIEVIDDPKKLSAGKNKKTSNSSNNKKEEEVMTDTTMANAAAFGNSTVGELPSWVYQQIDQQFNNGFIPENEGNVPAFIADGGNISGIDTSKEVPDFIAKNTFTAPKEQPRIFAPIEQQQYLDPRLGNYPWVSDIIKIGNGSGYMVIPELIIDSGNNPMMVYFRIFNQQAFLPDKSFLVDLGTVIDKRFGIWPCANPNGAFNPIETANEAYRLFNEEGKGNKRKVSLNTEFILSVIRFGFVNLDKNVKKNNILYGERMIVTNRVIALITMFVHEKFPRDKRNIIKGACIRFATILEKENLGRFRFESLNESDMSFTLVNDISPYFLGPINPAIPRARVTAIPRKDENGNYIPAGNGNGGDIIYDFAINRY